MLAWLFARCERELLQGGMRPPSPPQLLRFKLAQGDSQIDEARDYRRREAEPDSRALRVAAARRGAA